MMTPNSKVGRMAMIIPPMIGN